MAREGFIPVLHSIAPFVVERCFEQLKIDLCYQALPAKIVSVGGSYDYAGLGATHHCPEDVAILQTLPGMQIVVPGTPAEFDILFRASFGDRHPTYFRLSERSNPESREVMFGRAKVVREGSLATVLAVGPMLGPVTAAAEGLDITLLYYTTVAPFDLDTLLVHAVGRIAVVEPYLEGTTARQLAPTGLLATSRLVSMGMPLCFLSEYGRTEDHDRAFGLAATQIRERLEEFLRGQN
jgi:transketolase